MIKLSDTSVFAIVRADLIEHSEQISVKKRKQFRDRARTHENSAKRCFKRVETGGFDSTSSLKIEQQNELTTLSILRRKARER